MSIKYLDVSEQLAVERLSKAVEAFTLVNNLPTTTVRDLKGIAKAARLWAEVRKWEAAAQCAKTLKAQISRLPADEHDDVGTAIEVIEGSIATLRKRAGL